MPLLDQVTPFARFVVALLAGTASPACSWRLLAFVHRRRLEAHPDPHPCRRHARQIGGHAPCRCRPACGRPQRCGQDHRNAAKADPPRRQRCFDPPLGCRVDPRAIELRPRWPRARTPMRSSPKRWRSSPNISAHLNASIFGRPTCLITNVRPDHQEQLGDSPDAMARAIMRVPSPTRPRVRHGRGSNLAGSRGGAAPPM